MLIQRLILKEYNWAITILYQCTCHDLEDIEYHLDSINCPLELKKEALKNIETCQSNIGFTYSNFALGRTIMAISKVDQPQQLINTITHECYHFINHLAKTRNIEDEEVLATLTGRFNMQTWEIIEDIIN